MDRRDLLKLGLAAAAAVPAISLAADRPTGETSRNAGRADLAAPCGLYCGICVEYEDGRCHGCACTCQKCAAQPRSRSCEMAKCVAAQKLQTCAGCDDRPCTRLIQFTADPVWRTHLPCLENLRRQKKIGIDAWLAEQKAYWSDKRNRTCWLALGRECGERAKVFPPK